MNNQKQSDGAFWKKTAKSGSEYYSGHITIQGEKIYLAMFPNKNKKTEKQPDFDLKISEPKQQ